MLPLYGEAQQMQPSLQSGHAGLWYDKFCNTWRQVGGFWTLSAGEDASENPKLQWIQTLTRVACGHGDLLEEAVLRRLQMVETLGGAWRVFMTEGRFVTGLGRSHPVENGFAWHPTLGTPFLSGSSVKGLVLAWAREEKVEEERRIRLFGGQGKEGAVVFLDAIPVRPVHLGADVMTPHYAGWTEEDPPGDWRAPTPIPFLATEAGAVLLFAVVPAAGAELQEQDSGEVLGWLEEALQWAGAGAKTAVGYGRFQRDEKLEEEWRRKLGEKKRRQEEIRRAQQLQGTPEGHWLLELQDLSEAQLLDKVRVHLEKEPIEDSAERRAFIKLIKELGSPELWRKGKKKDCGTKLNKKKLKERARLLEQD